MKRTYFWVFMLGCLVAAGCAKDNEEFASAPPDRDDVASAGDDDDDAAFDDSSPDEFAPAETRSDETPSDEPQADVVGPDVAYESVEAPSSGSAAGAGATRSDVHRPDAAGAQPYPETASRPPEPRVTTAPMSPRSDPPGAPPQPEFVPDKMVLKDGITQIRVFYGTDRRATGSTEPNKFYGTERGPLRVGFCDVTIPPGHERGELEAPKIWKFEFRENPKKHVVLNNIEPVDGATFLGALKHSVQRSIRTEYVNGQPHEVGGETFVFIHGFNTEFQEAARRTAQIAFDLDFLGPPIMFSWPSQGSAALGAYREDARSAEWCEEHVMEFLTVIARHSGARQIHVIAHSMGNRVVSGAMRRLAYVHRSEAPPKFNQVILTAPDIDARIFKLSIAPRIVPLADRITIYASADDVALKASKMVNSFGDPRLGQGGEVLTTFPNFPTIDVVDASDVDTSLFGVNHSYYGDSESVLSDIERVLLGIPAESRGLRTLVKSVAWRVPERLKRLSSAARAKYRL